MAEAFMGYLLPWGQMSFWGAQVIVNLFSAIPLIGEPLSIWIRGDFVVGDATLNRFFSFHVIAVPLVLLGLVAAHILALHEVGSNNPDGIEIKKRKDVQRHPLDGIPFHPYYTVKDIVGVVVFLMVFSIIVFFAPEGGGYFLEYNNFLPGRSAEDAAAHRAGLVFHALLLDPARHGLAAVRHRRQVLGRRGDGCRCRDLAFLPWLDRSPVKSIRYRGPIYKTLLTLFVISFFLLGFLGTQPPSYAFFGVIPSAPVAQVLQRVLLPYFLTMPWWSKIDKYKPEPDRVTM
jgi:ubiquinol-cytochrome c reductase cytochrome b subunit